MPVVGTHAEVWEALREYLRSNYNLSPVSWEFFGEARREVGPKESCIRPLVVGEASAMKAKAGNVNEYRTLATLRIEIEVPLGSVATDVEGAIIDALMPLFRGKTVASVGTFYTPSVDYGGVSGGKRRRLFEVLFYRDTIGDPT